MTKKKTEETPEEKKELTPQEQKFLEVVRSADVSFYRKAVKKDEYRYSDSSMILLSNKERKELDLNEHYLYEDWRTGGISGGSCWDDGESGDPHYAIEGDKEPEFNTIDKILLAICPNLSYLQYKTLVTIIKEDSYAVNEYYGNCTYYAYKYVSLRDLFDKLVEMKLL